MSLKNIILINTHNLLFELTSLIIHKHDLTCDL